MKILGGIGVVLLLVGVWAVSSYNGLVGKNEAVNAAWGQVQNVYQRRLDLVPNLVETVKGAAKFERETLSAVVTARSKVGSFTVDQSVLDNPDKFRQFENAQGELGRALSRLMVVVERYPELRATQNFRDLQTQLEGTENRIAVERRSFNETAQAYNTALKVFPGVIVGRLAGFQPRPYFEAAPQAQSAPAVKF